MYNHYGLSEYKSNTVEILTSKITTKEKNIRGYHLIKMDITFFSQEVSVVELLEALQNKSNIINLDTGAFVTFVNEAFVYGV